MNALCYYVDKKAEQILQLWNFGDREKTIWYFSYKEKKNFIGVAWNSVFLSKFASENSFVFAAIDWNGER